MRAFYFITVVAQLAATVTAAVVPLHKRQGLPAPSSDPFYVLPANLSSYAPGQTIRTRIVQTAVPSPNLAQTVQIFYRTQNTLGNPDATVTTLFIPKSPMSPKRILSAQAWEDSVGFDCSPSWALTANSASINVPTVADTAVAALVGLSQGWYVVSPDHLGSDSAFMSGHQSGVATLDSLRAVGSYINMDLQKDRIALFGYSGAAHATAWAAHLADSYAPELPISGAVFGGTPYDLQEQVSTLSGTAGSPYLILAFAGLMKAYPDFNALMRSKFTDAAIKVIDQAIQPGFCLYAVPESWRNQNINDFFINGTAPIDDPVLKRVFQQSTLLQGRSNVYIPAPKMPLYVYHGMADKISSPAAAQAYVKQVCSTGGSVRFVQYPGYDHFQAQGDGSNQAIAWLWQTLMFGAPRTTCGAAR